MYWDYKNQSSYLGDDKHNGFDIEHLNMFHASGHKAWDILPNCIRQDIQSVSGSEHGRYYYPLGFDYRIFVYKNNFMESELIFEIPECVIKDIKESKAKILCISTYEGFPLDRFDEIIEKKIITPYNLDWSNFVLLTGNLILKSPKGLINVYYNSWEDVFHGYSDNGNTLERNLESIFSKKDRNKKYICLQRRPREQRILMYSKMYPYKDKGILTLGVGDKGLPGLSALSDVFRAARELFPRFADDIKNNLKMTLPRQYDVDVSKYNPVNPGSGDNDIEKYENSYLHIVCETYFVNTPNQMFFSEKIIKPLIFLQPFVLFGQTGSLRYLKQLGYKTFDPVIDESYDDIIDHQERFLSAFEQVEKIINMTDDQLNSLLYELSPILLHNYFNLKKRYESAGQHIDIELRKALDK